MSTNGLGDKVRRHRTQVLGISQEALARRAGLSFVTISGIELGKVEPRFDTLRKLATGLDLPLDRLLDEAS